MNHDRPAASTSLRPIGLPRALAVQAGADGMPITVARADGRGRPGTPVPVEQVDDVWRIAEAWWREAPQARTYYRVLLAGGRMLTLYRDDATGTWHEQPYTEATP